jgi:hypothetical protein
VRLHIVPASVVGGAKLTSIKNASCIYGMSVVARSAEWGPLIDRVRAIDSAALEFSLKTMLWFPLRTPASMCGCHLISHKVGASIVSKCGLVVQAFGANVPLIT